MRIVWKDSHNRKSDTYKGVELHKVDGGWMADIPGSDRVYEERYMVRRAINRHLSKTQNNAS